MRSDIVPGSVFPASRCGVHAAERTRWPWRVRILGSILAAGEHALSTEEGQHLVPIMHAVYRVRDLAIVR